MDSNQADRRSSLDSGRPAANLAAYDNARFVVFLGDVTERRPLYGRARFQRDDMLGNILRIPLEEAGPGAPALIISESEWERGVITRDYRHGADYCLILPSDWQADKDRSSDDKGDSSEPL